MARIKDGQQQFNAVFKEIILATASVNPAATGAPPSFASVDVTVPGAAVGDFVLVAPGVDTVDTTATGQVTAAGVVTVTVSNTTAGDVNLADSVWKIVVLKAAIE